METKSDKRVHGLEAAGAGDVGGVEGGEALGPCPSCTASLCVAFVKNPRTGRVERALIHPVPFCTYYGETDPTVIEDAVARTRGHGGGPGVS
jgi:hypothetical protein